MTEGCAGNPDVLTCAIHHHSYEQCMTRCHIAYRVHTPQHSDVQCTARGSKTQQHACVACCARVPQRGMTWPRDAYDAGVCPRGLPCARATTQQEVKHGTYNSRGTGCVAGARLLSLLGPPSAARRHATHPLRKPGPPQPAGLDHAARQHRQGQLVRSAASRRWQVRAHV